MPSISVVIPTRNRSALLKRAVTSVVKQSYTNFEILIINDASTDDTISVVERIADSRITLINNEICSGGGAARNRGIREARGNYIAFLDDGDTWEPHKLELQYAQIATRQDVFSFTGKWVFKRENSIPSYSFKKPRYPADQIRSIMDDNFIGVTSSVMAPRTALIDCGLFDEALPALQDYDLYIRLIPVCRALAMARPLTNYYLAPDRVQVSTDYQRFKNGRAHLLQKYKNHRFGAQLQKSLFFIHLRKMVKSVRYTRQVLAALNIRF